jgi:hypothetical protein
VSYRVIETGLGRAGPVIRAWPAGGLAGAVVDLVEAGQP